MGGRQGQTRKYGDSYNEPDIVSLVRAQILRWLGLGQNGIE